MRILIMTTIAALTIGGAAGAKPMHHAKAMHSSRSGAVPQSSAVADLNRKSLEQAMASNAGTPMAQPGMSSPGMAQPGMAQPAPMANPGAMNPGNTSTAPMAPGADATMPAPAPTGTTPPQ